ncbi:bifunctional methylenetetrahydrofolate dehydrogenase/methenyltetrahydrofolate cyclohydrolase [Arcanobacterium pinnipediorum]|uniref:Bifunctional protein FolD n=1 Tax=Arcanobacterium pinnipediorum TaxID=1503041 RepID=A0ABY5AJS9_9ACTO|nr:bifunctional methylenetetrahydrofolate dehydrogenase/methenyltetrahydrofolate cyclohydrolase [Arcanobacterium pinnipediorum]USR80245.1 bifunctional methylenetetrahydrofolate dehydrogenase/methenyltetrahydrofolate cyclohydrolase [Arcanobacterium pinnipediorum]
MDGRATLAQIKEELKEKIANLGYTPGLATVLVGENPGSQMYVNMKHRDCAEVGINSIRVDMPEESTTEEVLAQVHKLNEDPQCSGFIVQLPLPRHIDTQKVLEAIEPTKDVDGLHPVNIGRLANEIPAPIACTPMGIVELGRRYGVQWSGANVCIVGRGTTVGKPLAILLTSRSINATVDACHSATKDLAEHTLRADIIVAAAGVAQMITPDMVRPGAVVFDVGVSRVTDPQTGKSAMLGDVDPAVFDKAGFYSPNPGGVGPMTRAMLLSNVVEASEQNS